MNKTHTILHKTLKPKEEFRIRGGVLVTNNGNHSIDISIKVPVTLQDGPECSPLS